MRRTVLALAAQLALACGGGGGEPPPVPPPAADVAPPTTSISPEGGEFDGAVGVALVCDDRQGAGCAASYYTLDGSTPSTGSIQYTGPFTLVGTTTVRFFSVDVAGNAEAPQSVTFTRRASPDTAPPTTVATPASGSFNSPRSVTLTCDDGEGSGCAGTYYTLDGSVPTQSSPRYMAALTISASTTLRYFSVDAAGNIEPVRQAHFTVDMEAPRVSATPGGSVFTSTRTVTLRCDDGDGSGCAAIHYTLDNSIPSQASPRYQVPLVLTATTRVRFIAVDWAGNTSAVVSEQYSRDGEGPTTIANPPGGFFRAQLTVSLACDDGAGQGCQATYFTTNGEIPTRASTRYALPIIVSRTTMMRFFSVDAAGNDGAVVSEMYVVDGTAPVTVASLPGGAYGSEQAVTLSCDDGGGSGCLATYYTLDGSIPTTASPRYVSPLRISSSSTLHYFSVDAAGNAEDIQRVPFIIDTVAPSTTASPASGIYRQAQQVALTCADGAGAGCAAIRYSTESEAPVSSFHLYTGPLLVSGETRLRYYSVDAVGNAEPVKSETYVIDSVAPAVEASPRGGTYHAAQTVTLTCADAGTGCAAIHFTTDGSIPGPHSPRYVSPLTLSADTQLRFLAMDAAGNASAVVLEAYAISLDITAPVTTVTPAGGVYRVEPSVVLTCTDEAGGSGCAGTYYTLDGSEPTTASPRYTGPLVISDSATLRFFSVDAVGNAEQVMMEQYTVDTVAPMTAAMPAGGTYEAPVTVTLACSDSGTGCRETRYTVDGSTPGAGSPLYEGPITLEKSTTLQFASVDHAGNMETPRQEVYALPTTAAETSAQIRAVISAPTGPMSLPVDGARITFVKPLVGSPSSDPAGFFLQAEQAGPALFVEADPVSLSPAPEAGARVRVMVSEKLYRNGMRFFRISSYEVLSAGHALDDLIEDVSDINLPTVEYQYESQYISITGTIGTSGTSTFVSAGPGHVQAPLTTAGVPVGSYPAERLRLRVVEPLHDMLDLAAGCNVTVVSPLWLYRSPDSVWPTVQPSVWTRDQLTVNSCPAPRVLLAEGRGSQTVVVRFDRRIDASTLRRDGSQFSIPGLTVTEATHLGGRDVMLQTTVQTARVTYQVEVDGSVRDELGTGVDPEAATASFIGHFQRAVLRLSEIVPNVYEGRELVELVAVTGGSTRGISLMDEDASTRPLARLPDVEVAAGDIIVIHLRPDRSRPGADAPASETLGKSEYPQSTYGWNFDTAWDFHGENVSLGDASRTFRVVDFFGDTQDAVAVIRPRSEFPYFLTRLQALQAEGHWRPASCGGVLCTYRSVPTAWDVSVDWSWLFLVQGRDRSMHRIVTSEANSSAEWAVGFGSLGVPNP
ncbi:chitobiase/beta-hexosaminidase C-terminal domain-containing protein [Myxococcus sp. Y35]|uniref:chitobiase/beta-hexosaminidase C-terminal domain-containing protein n=1 Tax=Pseudomyxococcus flavus TaxID=3115648 RepID=UPI003CFB3F1A